MITSASIKTAKAAMKSKNDCSVQAIAIAMEIEYMTAYGMMLALGRTNRRGIDTRELYRFLDSLGFTSYPRPNMTVSNYVKLIAHSGNWLVSIRRHIFAVVNGEIKDWVKSDSEAHVLKAWRVK